MGKRTRTEEDIIRRKLAAYNVGLALTLSRPVEGSQLHIASGFLLEEAPGERMLVTAGHFIELVHRCLDQGIVEGICVHHQDLASEQNLKQYVLDPTLFKSQSCAAQNGIDVGLITIEEELSRSLDAEKVPAISTEKHCGQSEERKSCLVIGHSADGSTTVRLSTLEVIADGEHETHERYGIGNICGRFESIETCELDGGTIILKPHLRDRPSVKGMSGGLVVLVDDDKPDNLLWIGQQSTEKRTTDGKECEFLRATHAGDVVRGVLDCLDQFRGVPAGSKSAT